MTNKELKERGVLIMPSGKKWVKCCVSGRLIELKDAIYIGWSKGHCYWRHKHKDICGIQRGKLVPAK